MELSINNIPQFIKIIYQHNSAYDYCYNQIYEFRITKDKVDDKGISLWFAGFYPLKENKIETLMPYVPDNMGQTFTYMVSFGSTPNDACQELLEKLNETSKSWEETTIDEVNSERQIPDVTTIKDILKHAYINPIVDKDGMHNLKLEAEEIFKKLIKEL